MGDRQSHLVAVVTGGSSGIGQACARLLGQRGIHVYVMARSEPRLNDAVASLRRSGGAYTGIVCDVTDGAALSQAMEQIAAAEAGIDYLVLSHGVMDLKPVEALPLSAFEQMMEINYFGSVAAVQAALPLIRLGQGKRIVLIGSLAAKVAPPYFSAYAATKAALTGFAHALRQELRREGIGVMLVHPGPAGTPLIEGYIHEQYYRLPPGVPIVSAEKVAQMIDRSLKRCPRELYIPRRFRAVAWLAEIIPAAVDWTYAMVDRGSGPDPAPQEPGPTQETDGARPDEEV